MVNFYYAFDIVILIALVYLTKISYEKKIYLQFFEYFKVFIIISLSAKLSSYTAIVLQKLYITKADTYTTLILIAFVVNLSILYFSWKYILRFSNKFFNNAKIRLVLAKILTLLEVIILFTFAIYIVMQLYIVKQYIYPSIYKSYSYPKIEKFYKSFLNDDFVNMILNAESGTNHKEVIFESFKKSI